MWTHFPGQRLVIEPSACLKLESFISQSCNDNEMKWGYEFPCTSKLRVKSFKVLHRIRQLFDHFKSSIVTSTRENSDIDIVVYTFFCQK